jgi:hypothetical protein
LQYLWYRFKKVKAKVIFLNLVCFHEHFQKPSFAKLAIAKPKYDNLIEDFAWNLLKFTQKFWNCEALSFTDFFVNTLNIVITQYGWLTTLLFIMNICSPIFEHSSLLSYISVTHCILAVNLRVIHDIFLQFPRFKCEEGR